MKKTICTAILKTPRYQQEIEQFEGYIDAEEWIKEAYKNGFFDNDEEARESEIIIREWDEETDEIIRENSAWPYEVALYDCTESEEGQDAIDAVINAEIEKGGAAYEMLQDGYDGNIDAYKAEYKGDYTATMMADNAVRVRHVAGPEWIVEDSEIM